MAVADIYSLYSFDITSPAAAKFSRLSNVTMTGGLSVGRAFPAGLPFPMFASIRGGAPGMSFSTPQIDTLFDVTTAASGNGVTADLSAGSTLVAFEKVLAFGVRDATINVHPQFGLNDPLMYWSNITASHGGIAEANVQVVLAYDGSNSPISYTAVTASGVQVADEEFGLGQVQINSTVLGGVQSVSVESGVQIMQVGDESEIYPTFVAVRRLAPTVTIELTDVSYWNELGLTATSGGLALDGVDGLEVYFRKRANNGANATGSVHPKVAIINGLVEPVSVGASSGSGGRVGLRVHATTATDTVVPITASVNNAHP